MLKQTPTYLECREKSLLCKTRTEFYKNFPRQYDMAKKHLWLKDLCKNMIRDANNTLRMVYVYEIPTENAKYAYIGLTNNIQKRHQQHIGRKNDCIYKFCLEKKLKCPLPILLTDFLVKEKAAIIEDKMINLYKCNNWIVLNKKSGGALGRKFKEYNMSFKDCLESLLKYDTINQWRNNSNYGLYQYCKRMNYFSKMKKIFFLVKNENWDINKLNENLNKNIAEKYNRKHKYSKKYCMNIISKYKTLEEFRKNEINLYAIINNNKWNKELLSGLKKKKIFKSKILQLDKNKNLIKEWDSPIYAARELQIDVSHICKCLKHKIKTYKECVWEYKIQ